MPALAPAPRAAFDESLLSEGLGQEEVGLADLVVLPVGEEEMGLADVMVLPVDDDSVVCGLVTG